MGVGDTRAATYSKLPPGDFWFRVQEITALGLPTGIEDCLRVHVPVPLSEAPLFWPAVLTSLVAVSVLSTRSLAWYRMRREVARLRQQRALEHERLRIAQDIHDDLGARVTQISLFSAMAQDNPVLPAKARADFDNISRMTRELVTALYETVWAVNPENDNLDALGNYLCQLVNQLCNQAKLRCRFDVGDLPSQIQVSSQTRHNITMAVKEAVHNIIKHANAEEVHLHVGFADGLLDIIVRDDGTGFAPANQSPGSGLNNMKRRLADVGGSCRIDSQLGRGTEIEMRMTLNSHLCSDDLNNSGNYS
jgi:signal transduction histidine kinase